MKKILTSVLAAFLGRKRAMRLLGAALFLAGIIYSLTLQYPITEQAAVSQISPTSMVASPSATPAPRHGGIFTTVVSVVDGDTIKIEGGEVVRYIGVNTPETVAPNRPVECMGREASARNKELVQGKIVELEKDVSQRDRYGRLLRFVWVGDTMVNEQLVREGFAQVSTYPPDVKYQPLFVEAQRLAIEEKKGLWSGTCPLPTVKPDTASPSATPSV